ncbi:MAG TPA: PEGA domain-containing protein, partial [Candidatus Eisenbacteria bacterium]
MSEPAPDRAFTAISPNPFIVGNPVRGRAMFFGREAEFELVRRRFEHSPRGGMLLVFCGERRSGKTSILFQILDRRLGPDFIPVLIDMQSMAIGSEVEFLTRISQEVIEALGPDASGVTPPEFIPSASNAATFQTFIRGVLRIHPRKKLILMFDEYELFEDKIQSGLLAEEVLHILKSLMENQSVFLIFTGSRDLEERRNEYWKILGATLPRSISFLEREDALNLVRKPVEGRVQYQDGVPEAICRLTAGQPFYTQAVCQSLVDHLNEQRTHQATLEALETVADGLVNNPLPQMIFLWDGLERDEKLVLALLAECLADEDAHAGVDQMMRVLRQREYPLELSKARAATMLEKLFRSEMLLRRDRATLHEYAFRMDLWRLWIRRMHSVWQVMRELGLEIRPGLRGMWERYRWPAIGMAGAIALVAAGGIWRSSHRTALTSFSPSRAAAVPFRLEVGPQNAMVYMDHRLMGMGMFQDSIAAGQDHRFRVTAPGYADTEIVVQVPPGGSGARRLALRALFGTLSIVTQPPAADVKVDGTPAGKSPVMVRGLAVATPHRVEATLSGYGAAQQDVTVQANAMVEARLALEAGHSDLFLITDPPASEIRLDGSPRGTSPLQLAALVFGRHTLTASRTGYLTAETSVVVTQATHQIRVSLLPEPPGTLVVQGDQPGQIYIDGEIVVENVQNSGPRRLAAGTHPVRVVLVAGDTIDTSLVLKSG